MIKNKGWKLVVLIISWILFLIGCLAFTLFWGLPPNIFTGDLQIVIGFWGGICLFIFGLTDMIMTINFLNGDPLLGMKKGGENG